MSSRREPAASSAPSDGAVSAPTPPAAAAAAAAPRPPSRRTPLANLAPPARATSALDTTTRRRRALAELERRIAALEAQGRDLEQRNEQLRRQVACRTTAAEAHVMVACVIGVDGGGKVEGGSLEIHAPGTSAARPDSAATLAEAAVAAAAAAAAAAGGGAPQGALRRSFRHTRSGFGGVVGGGSGGDRSGAGPGFSTAAATAQAMAAAVAAADDDHAVRAALAAADKERMLRASVMGMMARQQPQQQQPLPSRGGGVAAGHDGNQDHHNAIASSATSTGILATAIASLNRLVEQMRDEALQMTVEEYARILGALNARLGLAIWRHGGKAGAAPAEPAALRAIEADIEPTLVRAIGRLAALARYRPEVLRQVLGIDLDTLRPLPQVLPLEMEDARMVRATRAAAFSGAQLSMLAALYEYHLPITWRVDERMRAAAAAAAAASAGAGNLQEVLAEVRGALADTAAASNAAAASFFQVVTPAQLAVICASLHPRAVHITHGLRGCYLLWREQQQEAHKEEGGGGAGAGGSSAMARAAEPLQVEEDVEEEEEEQEKEEQEEQDQGRYARPGAPISLA